MLSSLTPKRLRSRWSTLDNDDDYERITDSNNTKSMDGTTAASKAVTSTIGPLPFHFASEELFAEDTGSTKPKTKNAPAFARSRTAPVSYSRQNSRDRAMASPRRAKSSELEVARPRSPRRATQAQGRIPRKARRSPQRDESFGSNEGSRSRSPNDSGPRRKTIRRKASFDQTGPRSPRRATSRSRSPSQSNPDDGEISDLEEDELQFIRSEYQNHLRRATSIDANSGSAIRPKKSGSPNLRRSKSVDEDSQAFARKRSSQDRDNQGKRKTIVLQKAVSARNVIDRHPPRERSDLRKSRSARNVDNGRMSSLQKALSAKNVVNAASQRGDQGKAPSAKRQSSDSPKKSSSLQKALSERTVVKTSASDGRGDMKKAMSARHVVRSPSSKRKTLSAKNESSTPSDTNTGNMSNSARSPSSSTRAQLKRSLSDGCEGGGALSARMRLQRAASARRPLGSSSHHNILDESDLDSEPFGEAEPSPTPMNSSSHSEQRVRQMNSSSHSEQRVRQMNSSSHSEHRTRSRSPPRSPRCPGRPRLCTKHSGIMGAQLNQLGDHLEEEKQKEEAFVKKQKRYTNGLTQLVQFDTADKPKETQKPATSKDANAGKEDSIQKQVVASMQKARKAPKQTQKADTSKDATASKVDSIQKHVLASMQKARKAEMSSSEHKGGKGRLTAIKAMGRKVFGSETKSKGPGFKVSGPCIDDVSSSEAAPSGTPPLPAILVPLSHPESEELQGSNADLESLDFGLDVKSTHTAIKLPLMT